MMEVLVQAFEALTRGENSLSSGASPARYGELVVAIPLPRKALNTINYDSLYPKPTQVGK